MNDALVEQVARAVLYEGYILYPYRPSSVKNRQRWTFGGIYPRAYVERRPGADAWSMQAQCLATGGNDIVFSVNVRFLHLVSRTVERADDAPPATGHAPTFRLVESLEVGGQLFQSWQEAVERDVTVTEPRRVPRAEPGRVPRAEPGRVAPDGPQARDESQMACDGPLVGARAEGTSGRPLTMAFDFPRHCASEELRDAAGRLVGRIVREQRPVRGVIECAVERMAGAAGVWRLTVVVRNETPMDDGTTAASRDDALLQSLVSSHVVLRVERGAFVSLTDPPKPLKALAAECQNVGCWPVLVGREGDRDTMLASPIILPDYPQIAPESPGDLFDGTEIDEILTLRIMTMTDDEKRQAAAVDGRAGEMLARTEALARQQLMSLHGAVRGLRPVDSQGGDAAYETVGPTVDAMADVSPDFGAWDPLVERKLLEKTLAAGIELKPGDRVRLRPAGRADIMDIALRGRTATIEAIEQDFENRIHLAVTVDDDPGRDFGRAGKIGHRFFFSPDDVEVLSPDEIADANRGGPP